MGFSLRENASTVKGHTMAAIGETLGTAMFLFIAEGAAKTANLARTNVQTEGNNAPLDSQTIMMIATSFGLSLLVTAWMFYRITGGLFNPAITVALWITGVLTTGRAVMLFIAQLIGGIIASALVLALTPAGQNGVDGVRTTVSGQTSTAQAFILEFLGTSVLVFSVLMLAVEKHRATYLAPVGIGLTLFVLHLLLVAWTGCSVNPARSLGPAAVSGNFSDQHWIYWVAPICGSILSVCYFQILKVLNYNSVVLDQDADHEVSGLRPVYMRAYKKLRGHHDWRQNPESKKRRAMWIMRKKKVMREDGTAAVVETPVMIDVEQGHPHDEVLAGPEMMSNGTSETLASRPGTAHTNGNQVPTSFKAN